jgi:hypothetical protein
VVDSHVNVKRVMLQDGNRSRSVNVFVTVYMF